MATLQQQVRLLAEKQSEALEAKVGRHRERERHPG